MLVVPLRACSRCVRVTGHSSSSAAATILYRSSIHTRRKLHSSIVPDEAVQKHMPVHAQPSFQNYFSANDALDRGWLKNGILATWRSGGQTTITSRTKTTSTWNKSTEVAHPTTQPQAGGDVAPHRRRWLQRRESAAHDESLPLDASSRLTTAASAMPQTATLRRTLATYLSLSKPRLSFLILLTTTSAYSLYPIPDLLSSADADSAAALSTSTLTFLYLTTGTFLSCASANAINMLLEPKSDALMTRTRNRPLVRGLISPRGASVFAAATATTGLALLYLGTNPTVAALSAINVVLYGFVYTPLKRVHWLNTWVGAVVGGIPPLMGWVAAAGQAATIEHHSWRDLLFSTDSVGGWLMAALLFAWQFPHFNSLSHTIRQDYRNAGHKMLCWINPARNARVALRYSLLMFPICFGLYSAGLVNPGFLVISTACNAWMLKEAIRFARYQGAKGSARGLFWASVWQLPLVLVGALLCKTGIWDGFMGTHENNEGIDDKTSLRMDLSQPLSNAATDAERQRAHNWAMMGFKRPS